jgi:hypothetical protein
MRRNIIGNRRICKLKSEKTGNVHSFDAGCNSARVKGDRLDKRQRNMSNNTPHFSVAQPRKRGLDRLIVEVSGSHTIGSTHPLGFLWTSEQPVSQHYAQRTQKRNIHALSKIRARDDPSNQAAADLCLRHRGHRDGQPIIKLHNYWCTNSTHHSIMTTVFKKK